MKALILSKFSKRPLDGMAVGDAPDPAQRAARVLVRMSAAALNPADLHIASGEMKMMSPVKPPFALGVDGTGVVENDGARFRRGQRVMFYTGLVHCGTLTERMSVPEEWLAKAPDAWSDDEAAAAPLALLVASKVLERAGAKAGESILVNGAGGSVGAATVALAAARGLSVHGVGSGADQDYARSLGAQGFTDYHSASVRALPQRFDIVLDAFGGNSLADSCAVVKSGGCIVSLKTMTGTDDMEAQGMKIPWFLKRLMPLVFRKPRKLAESSGARLIGLASFPDGVSLARAADEALAVGYRPRIDSEFALDDALAAFRRLQSAPRGKVVVRLPGVDGR